MIYRIAVPWEYSLNTVVYSKKVYKTQCTPQKRMQTFRSRVTSGSPGLHCFLMDYIIHSVPESELSRAFFEVSMAVEETSLSTLPL